MDGRSLETAEIGGVAAAAPPQLPSQNALRWLMGLRLVVISTLFLGILLIQINSQRILPLRNFYGLILFSYGLSLIYLILYARKTSPRVQSRPSGAASASAFGSLFAKFQKPSWDMGAPSKGRG